MSTPLSGLYNKLIINPFVLWLGRHPKIKTFIVIVLILFPFAFGAFFLIRRGWRPKIIFQQNQIGLLVINETLGQKTESEEIAEKLAPGGKSQPQFSQQCNNGWVCSDFSEGDFTGWGEYSINQLNKRSIQVSSDSVWDSPPLFFNRSETKIKFLLVLKATPKDPLKGNIVIFWNEAWRCIIAETDYNKVSCEANYQTPKKIVRAQNFLSTKGKKPISPGKEVKIEINSDFVPSDNNNKIKMVLDYIDIDGKRETADFEWDFELPTPDIENFKQLVGVGVIDPKNEKVEVEFNRLELLPTK